MTTVPPTPLLFAAPAQPAAPTQIIRATPYVLRDPTTIPTRQWLYRPGYIRKFISATFSPGGIGKSSVVIVEMLAMASGKALVGVTPEKQLRVWYWNGEDPGDELDRRIAATVMHYQLTAEQISDRLFVDSGRTMPIVLAEEMRFDIRVYVPVIEQVIQTLKENQIDVLIVDPFVSCHRVSENDNNAIERVAKAWAHIAEVCNCAIMLVHHTRKTNGDSATVEDGRGASALRDAVRSARVLNTMTAKEAELAEIEVSKRRLYIRADNGKANMMAPAEHADWYRLVSVELGNGQVFEDAQVAQFSGLGGDNVGVVSAWRYPVVRRTVVAVEDVARAQALMEAGGPWRQDPKSKSELWIGVALAQALELDLSRPQVRKEVAKMVGEWVVKGWLEPFEGQDRAYKTHTYVRVGQVRVAADESDDVPF